MNVWIHDRLCLESSQCDLTTNSAPVNVSVSPSPVSCMYVHTLSFLLSPPPLRLLLLRHLPLTRLLNTLHPSISHRRRHPNLRESPLPHPLFYNVSQRYPPPSSQPLIKSLALLNPSSSPSHLPPSSLLFLRDVNTIHHLPPFHSSTTPTPFPLSILLYTSHRLPHPRLPHPTPTSSPLHSWPPCSRARSSAR